MDTDRLTVSALTVTSLKRASAYSIAGR